MQHRAVHTCLPAYAQDAVGAARPFCFTTIRHWQLIDDDFASEVGPAQRELARTLDAQGDGRSILIASTPGDSVLVRATPEVPATRVLRDELDRLAEHLGRCGIEVGEPVFSEDVEAALHERARDSWICPVLFSNAVARAIGDDDAKRHRGVVRALLGKATGCRATGFDSRVLDTEQELAHFLEEAAPPWVFKPTYAAGGKLVRIVGVASEATDAWAQCKEQGGSVTAQPYAPGSMNFTTHLLDPAAGTVCRLLTGSFARDPGSNFSRCEWTSDTDPAGLERTDAAAFSLNRLAQQQGASLLLVNQDWANGFAACFDVNPRWASITPLSIYLARTQLSPQTITHLVLPHREGGLASLLGQLRPLECTKESGAGAVVYATSHAACPVLMVMLVNDLDKRVETHLRRCL